MEAQPRSALLLIGILALVNAAYWAYSALYPFPADADPELIAHGAENGAKLTGALVGMGLGCWIDQSFVHSDVRAPIWGQICKAVLGLACVLLIKEFVRFVPDFVRYGLMTLFAAGVWPMTFPLFRRFGKNKK